MLAGINEWSPGRVFVMLGNGDGTFDAAVEHPTGVNGSVTVVVGDFNGDGRLDAATGNNSWRFIGDFPCGAPPNQFWDSVTILAGRGDGTFAAPVTFNLDYQRDSAYRNSHNTLKTSDVNGDRRTDLITSAGAIVLNVPVAANRAPTVNAGPDQIVDDEGFARVAAAVADPDNDFVSVVWRNQAGQVIADYPAFCGQFDETTTLTVTVTDARGASATDSVLVFLPEGDPPPLVGILNLHEGRTISRGVPFTIEWAATDDPHLHTFTVASSSNDGQTWTTIPGCASLPSTARECVWSSPGPVGDMARVRVLASTSAGAMSAFGISERFSIVAGPPTSLPFFWRQADVGTVSAEGNGTFNGSVFTVRGSGADIWGTADEFHYVFTLMNGDFDVTARVTSVENLHPQVKAGIMIRSDLRAGAPHASLFASPIASRGLRFQRRRTLDGTSVNTTGPGLVAPVWLKLARRGNTVASYYRKAITDPWRRIGVDTITDLGHGAQVGLAVSSHVDGQLATATFDNVTIDEVPFWRCEDIGAVGVPGRCSGDSVVGTIEGSGTDIWGTADAFRYKYAQWFSDATITVRVRGLENTNASAKAGVMFRESTAPGSKQVMMVFRPGNGLAMQYRAATGGTTVNAAPARAATTPEWVRLTRVGDRFTGFTSNDGVNWVTFGAVTVPMTENLLVGLPVTSRNNATLATAVFDDLVVRR